MSARCSTRIRVFVLIETVNTLEFEVVGFWEENSLVLEAADGFI